MAGEATGDATPGREYLVLISAQGGKGAAAAGSGGVGGVGVVGVAVSEYRVMMVSPEGGSVRACGAAGAGRARDRSTAARGGPGGSNISVTTDVLSARMRVFDHL